MISKEKAHDASIDMIELLMALTDGEGSASVTMEWDSALGDPVVSLTCHRERSGTYKSVQRKSVSEIVEMLTGLACT